MAVLIALAIALLSTVSIASKSPHILLVVVDDLGWSDVGYHNITDLKTPNIDRLAAQGTILENYYVQPICSPTRSALLSGRYPIHTGLQHGVIKPTEPYGLPLDFTLLPKKLKQAGYATHMVGKWHLGFFEWEYTPLYRGFDTFYGFYNGAEDHFTHERSGILDLHDQKEPVRNKKNEYSAHIFSERAKEIISAHDPSKPLFLYLPFQCVHDPAQAPIRFVDMYKHIKNKLRRHYAGMVSAVDEAIGNVTQALQQKGLWDDTVMIFTTDNGGIPGGGGYDWPLRGHKATLWEGGVRGAAFVHSKMLKNKGSRSKELLHVTDWYPTLAALAGLDVHENGDSVPPLDGMDVWETIATGAPSPRKEILVNIDTPSQNPLHDENLLGYEGSALRVGDMKILVGVPNITWFKPPELGGSLGRHWWRNWRKKDRIEVALYNITADPEERHDMSQKLPDVVAKLRQRLDYYMSGAVPSGKKPADKQARKTAEKKGSWGPWKEHTLY
ncbi:arylsulfatase B [Nematostella vectensis]|uniref:arylsulfatase B n=1 Tax=Nematostella vectensis TaxID=45351 RepID=UPI002076F2F2|nr:arylsulfatase B [Nematostella vectensis]